MEVRRLFTDLAYPANFTQAFGELMIEFASLEADLFGVTIELVTDDYCLGAVLLAGVPYSGLVDRFCALVLLIARGSAEIEETANELRGELLDVSERRNRLVHSEWLFEPIEGSVSRIKATARGKRGLRFDTPTVPVSELSELVADIRQVRRRCNDLATRVFALYRKQPKSDAAV